MWLLNFLPDSFITWIVNLVILAGLSGVAVSAAFKYVIKYFPQLIPYRTILQIVSVVLLAFGVYLKGGQVVEEKWRARVAELEAKVSVAEQQSKDANVQLKSKVTEKIRVIKETQVVVQEKIRDVQVKVDSQCKITAETIDVLNQAARGIKK